MPFDTEFMDKYLHLLYNTGNDRYSGHGYSGNDRFSGTKPLTTQFYLLLVESPL